MKGKERLDAVSAVIAIALLLITAGAIVTGTLARIGLGENYGYILSLTIMVCLLLLRAGRITIALVLVGLLASNLPDAILMQYRIDRDILLAITCAILVAPYLYDLITD